MESDSRLPAGWFENEHGVFWRQTAQGAWFGMHTAPRDGRSFVWLRPTIIVGRGVARVEFKVSSMRREGHERESGGYWMEGGHSVADHYARHGWWTCSAPLTHDGRLVMPYEAFEYILEKTKPVMVQTA